MYSPLEVSIEAPSFQRNFVVAPDSQTSGIIPENSTVTAKIKVTLPPASEALERETAKLRAGIPICVAATDEDLITEALADGSVWDDLTVETVNPGQSGRPVFLPKGATSITVEETATTYTVKCTLTDVPRGAHVFVAALYDEQYDFGLDDGDPMLIVRSCQLLHPDHPTQRTERPYRRPRRKRPIYTRSFDEAAAPPRLLRNNCRNRVLQAH